MQLQNRWMMTVLVFHKQNLRCLLRIHQWMAQLISRTTVQDSSNNRCKKNNSKTLEALIQTSRSTTISWVEASHLRLIPTPMDRIWIKSMPMACLMATEAWEMTAAMKT
jgi:hypothetical protein